jgi:hypothetical protein
MADNDSDTDPDMPSLVDANQSQIPASPSYPTHSTQRGWLSAWAMAHQVAGVPWQGAQGQYVEEEPYATQDQYVEEEPYATQDLDPLDCSDLLDLDCSDLDCASTSSASTSASFFYSPKGGGKRKRDGDDVIMTETTNTQTMAIAIDGMDQAKFICPRNLPPLIRKPDTPVSAVHFMK